MSNSFLADLNKYRKFCTYEEKENAKVQKISTRIIILAYAIPVVLSFLNSVYAGIGTIAFLLGFSIALPILDDCIQYIVEKIRNMISGKDKLHKAIVNHIYTGEIYDIFNKDCENTRYILKENKEKMSNSIYHNKGLEGSLILSMIETIDILIERDAKKQNYLEEKEALINGNTKVGEMLKTVNEI